MVVRDDTSVRDLISENERVVIMFGASWCGPCKSFKPKFQKLSLENPDIVFAYCDADETSNFLAESKIQSVPTTFSYFCGNKHEDMVGDSIDRAKAMVESLRSAKSLV